MNRNTKGFLLLPLLCALIFNGCVQTRTDQPAGTVYHIGDRINIYDKDNDGALCSLTVISAKKLKREPVTVEEASTDSSGEAVVIEHKLQYFIEITCQYTNHTNSPKSLSGNNFDLKNTEVWPNPGEDDAESGWAKSKETITYTLVLGMETPPSTGKTLLTYSYSFIVSAIVDLDIEFPAADAVSSQRAPSTRPNPVPSKAPVSSIASAPGAAGISSQADPPDTVSSSNSPVSSEQTVHTSSEVGGESEKWFLPFLIAAIMIIFLIAAVVVLLVLIARRK